MVLWCNHWIPTPGMGSSRLMWKQLKSARNGRLGMAPDWGQNGLDQKNPWTAKAKPLGRTLAWEELQGMGQGCDVAHVRLAIAAVIGAPMETSSATISRHGLSMKCGPSGARNGQAAVCVIVLRRTKKGKRTTGLPHPAGMDGFVENADCAHDEGGTPMF